MNWIYGVNIAWERKDVLIKTVDDYVTFESNWEW
jgi:hypothetical protein